MRTVAWFRRALPVLLPAVLMTFAVWFSMPYLDDIGIRRYPLLRNLPALLLCAGVVLGILFHQSRVAALAVLLAGVTHLGATGHLTPSQAVLASAILPAIVIASTAQSDLRLFSWNAVMRLVLSLVLMGFIAVSHAAPLSGIIAIIRKGPVMAAWLPLPPLSLGLTLAAAAAMLVSRRRRTNAIILQSLVAALVALSAALRAAPGLWYGSALASAFLILWATLDGAWQHAFIDELTGLPGRRPLEYHLASLGRHYALAIADIDHFKRINDRHGHDVGDQVLRFVASQLRAFRHGTAYRYGGEEFVLVMRKGNLARQTDVLQELRKQIAEREFVIRSLDRPRKKPSRRKTGQLHGRGAVRVTVSIGLAQRRDTHRTPSAVIQAADKALYKAKGSGRNRVCVA